MSGDVWRGDEIKRGRSGMGRAKRIMRLRGGRDWEGGIEEEDIVVHWQSRKWRFEEVYVKLRRRFGA